MECRKHNHQGTKGVCASCLRDQLSRLPNTTSYYIINRSDRSSSSTNDSSSPSSPMKDHRRAGSMSMSMSMSFAVREALSGNLIEALGGGLKKSRSMAHVPRNYIVGDSKKKKKTTEKLKSTTAKKTGFWTKLLHLKGKGGATDVGGLVTSRQRA